MTSLVGHTASHYKILEHLGKGGMGVVYKSYDATLDRDVALTFLPQYLTSDPEEKERFHQETRAAAALTHPNVAVVQEIGEYNGQLYIAMGQVEARRLCNSRRRREVTEWLWRVAVCSAGGPSTSVFPWQSTATLASKGR
jgi:serine/threonine protein kinase